MLYLGLTIHKKLVFNLAIFTLLTLGALLYEYIDEESLTYSEAQTIVRPEGNISITIKINLRILELYNDGKVYKKYRIAVGKQDSPTPIGEWRVIYKSYSDKEILGTRWIGLDVPWGSYGIHGTNRPWSIGQFASKGCIRMRKKDIEELFEWVPIGTPVLIEGNKIKIERTLQYPSAGPDVVMLQKKLKQLGYYTERADGLFGRTTEAAVKIFQESKNLQPTGIVDNKLLRLLGL